MAEQMHGQNQRIYAFLDVQQQELNKEFYSLDTQQNELFWEEKRLIREERESRNVD